MKYFVLPALLSFCFAIAHAQITTTAYWTNSADIGKKAADIIHYSRSRPLTWADFKGTATNTGMEAALTASGFGYNLSMRTSGSQGNINISVYCYFDKKGSWVKPKGLTPYILNHEQRHFDITYIAAYDFLQRVKTLSLSTNTCASVLQNVYSIFSSSLSKMQSDYDEQTEHGLNAEMQQKWNNFIAERLKGIIE